MSYLTKLKNSNKSEVINTSLGDVELRRLSISEYMQFDEMINGVEQETKQAAVLTALSIVENDERTFNTFDQCMEFHKLIPPADFINLMMVAQRINGFDGEPEKK